MKICYVAPDVIIPYNTGASTHVFELAYAFSCLGDEVHVIGRRWAAQPRFEKSNGIAFHRLFRGIVGPLPTSNHLLESSSSESAGLVMKLYSGYLQSGYALYSGAEAARIIQENALDVILERETAFGAGAIASRLSKRPMILELIGPA
jgi:hypothetical protein